MEADHQNPLSSHVTYDSTNQWQALHELCISNLEQHFAELSMMSELPFVSETIDTPRKEEDCNLAVSSHKVMESCEHR